MNTSPEIIRAWLDVPLDAHGKQEAQALGQQFRGKPVSKIYSSDLQRCLYTAQQIGQATGVPVTATNKLRPWNVGSYAGVPLVQVKNKVAGLVRKPHTKAPNGESFVDFVTRLDSAIRQITHVAVVAPQPVVVVTHSRDIRVTLIWIEEGIQGVLAQPPRKWLAEDTDPVDTGHYIELNWTGGRWVAGKAQNG